MDHRHDPLDPQHLARFLAAMAEEREDGGEASDVLGFGSGGDAAAFESGGDAAAFESGGDAALRQLLAGLPRPAPRPGFAERAALAAAMAARPALAAAPAGVRGLGILRARWRRVLLAACLAATACGVALLPWIAGMARLLLDRFSLAGAAALAVRLAALALGELAAAAADLTSLWQRLATPALSLQRALATALARPGGALAAALCLLISALALRFLHDLVERERSWNHAHPSR